MLSRRDFLKMAVAGAATQLLPKRISAEEQQDIDINATLQTIANTLRAEPLLATVNEHLVDKPSIGFTQWRWWHFRPDIDDAQLPQIEEVNAGLLPAMHAVSALPHAGLDVLLQEGFISGKIQSQIEDYQHTHRQIVELQNTFAVPFASEIRPTQEVIEKELRNPEHVTRSVNQFVYPDGRPRQVKLSPLARFGAGFILSQQKGITLLPAEDPVLDAKAEEAERNGTQADYAKWVITERDAHFVKLVRESKRKMVHLLVGGNHDLTDDVALSNSTTPERISHLVVTVKNLRDREQLAKK